MYSRLGGRGPLLRNKMIEAVREQVPQEHIDKLELMLEQSDLLSFPADFRIFLMGNIEPFVVIRLGKAASFH